MAVHSINTNQNTLSKELNTVRQGNTETSTLLSLVIPAWANGSTCNTVIFAGKQGRGDTVSGTASVDIFSTLITDINDTPAGNQRNAELARMVFGTANHMFNFDDSDVPAKIQNFPCPGGKTLQWEIVAVGDGDSVIIQQDFIFNGTGFPNGLSITIS